MNHGRTVLIHRFSFPTNIVFGPGAVREIGPLAKQLGGTKALIVTDPGVAAAGLTAPVRDSLTEAGIACSLYEGVDPNPTEANVEGGVDAYRRNACDII